MKKLHYHTVLVVYTGLAFPHFSVARRCHLHGHAAGAADAGAGPAADSRADRRQSLLCTFVARVRCLDVPDVGLQDVTTAAYAHFREVTHGVLRLDQP